MSRERKIFWRFPEFPHRNKFILFLDQLNTGSVAGDLESGTPVPQEVPENVQVEK